MLRLFDWEQNPLNPDDYVGSTFFSVSDAFIVPRDEIDAKIAPLPQWHSIIKQESGDSEGEILASVQLIRKKYPDEVLPSPQSIVPKTRKVYLELTILGLRGLQPFQFLSINMVR